jgi:histone acetyltransferase (RNA polymerase elongator complex component)
MKKKNSMKNTNKQNLEEKFDRGESVLDYFETNYAIKRVSLDIPQWAIVDLDKEAKRRGLARQALIKHWIIDKLDELKKAG